MRLCKVNFFAAVAGLCLIRRSHALTFSVTKDQASNNTFDFQDMNNISQSAAIYTAELTVSGRQFLVQIDTGSSDLWLDTSGFDVSGLQNTGYNTTITYGDTTSAEGPILIGNVTLGDFTVGQAFISASGSNATTYNDTGLLGVGPPLLSQVYNTLNGTSYYGAPFLSNVFETNSSLSPLISFLLNRSETTGTTGGGIFTIGEIASNFTNVTSSPQLNVLETDRWVVFMDGIVVNGKNFSGGSAFSEFNITNMDSNQTLANLDTGTALATIPPAYAHAIYGSVHGAHFDKENNIYTVPCDAKINVSFVFGGKEYPVHPIDTVQAGIDENGSIGCFSGFIPVDVDPKEDAQDLLLGDSFLRNVYSVFNFGAFVKGNNTHPSIQLVSTTNAKTAYAEFDTLSAQRNQSLASAGVKGSIKKRSIPLAHLELANILCD